MKISEVNKLAREYLEESQATCRKQGGVPTMLWIDVETTGLDPASEVLLEVGLLVTDEWGNVVPDGVFSTVVKPADFSQKLKNADNFVKDMHNSNGLIKEVWRVPSSLSPGHVDEKAEAFVAKHFGDEKVPLAGSSVHFDRNFVAAHMPKLLGAVSYRNVDISTLKELHSLISPKGEATRKEQLKPWRAHRVIPDLIDTIKEYQFYQRDFLWTKRDQHVVASMIGGTSRPSA